jgi:isopenicillin-N N-acyltransferase like protein
MNPFQMNVLEISGTPRQCGQKHGEALRDQIQELRRFFIEQSQVSGEAALEELCWQLLNRTGFIAAAARWTPQLVDEIEGISQGAGVGLGIVWAFQHQDEMNCLSVDLEAGMISGDEACTSLGHPPQGTSPTILAQNLDTPAIYHGKQTLLKQRFTDSPLEALIITEPGLVGICGMNNLGLGVCQNTLANQMNRSRQGLAAMLVIRGVLSQPSLEKAVEFLKTIRHASGINYALGDPLGVADYECSPHHVCRYVPLNVPEWIFHTNHPLVNDDLYPLHLLSMPLQKTFQFFISNSTTRFSALQKRVVNTNGPISVESVKTILCSHDSEDFPICRHERPELGPMGGRTNNSIIMLLSAQPEMYLAAGEPCQSEYRKFDFQNF